MAFSIYDILSDPGQKEELSDLVTYNYLSLKTSDLQVTPGYLDQLDQSFQIFCITRGFSISPRHSRRVIETIAGYATGTYNMPQSDEPLGWVIDLIEEKSTGDTRLESISLEEYLVRQNKYGDFLVDGFGALMEKIRTRVEMIYLHEEGDERHEADEVREILKQLYSEAQQIYQGLPFENFSEQDEVLAPLRENIPLLEELGKKVYEVICHSKERQEDYIAQGQTYELNVRNLVNRIMNNGSKFVHSLGYHDKASISLK